MKLMRTINRKRLVDQVNIYLVIYFFFSLILQSHYSIGQTIEIDSTSFQRIYLDDWDGAEYYSPNNFISKIEQDQKGFLWMATNAGLIRYDGVSELVFDYAPGRPNNVPLSVVTSMLQDSAGNFWLGHYTGDKLVKFNAATREVTIYTKETLSTQIDFTDIRSLGEADNAIWIGTNTNSLVRFDPHTYQLKQYAFTKGDTLGLPANDVRALLADNDNQLWIGTISGLAILDLATDQYTFLSDLSNNQGKLSNDYITALTKDSLGNIWIGTLSGGVNYYNRQTEVFSCIQTVDGDTLGKGQHVTDILVEGNKVWVGTLGKGIYEFNQLDKSIVLHDLNYDTDKTPYMGNGINDLLLDHQKNLWAGSYKGLQQKVINKNYFNKPKRTESTSIQPWKDSLIWVGSVGLNVFNKANEEYIPAAEIHPELEVLKDGLVRQIYEDNRGKFWYVLQASPGKPNRLVSYNPTTQEVEIWFDSKNGQGPFKQIITSITQSKDDQFWIGSAKGLFLLEEETKEIQQWQHEPNNPNSLPHNFILKLHEDQQGNVWVGTQRKGLAHFNPKTNTFSRFDGQEYDLIHSSTIYTFHEDANGFMWAGGNLGLYQIDKQTLQATLYLKEDGLSNNKISGIEGDRQGNIWVSTAKGLNRFNPTTKTFRNYFKSDGLSSNSFVWGAHAADDHGNLFFGGDGVLSFNPNNLADDETHAPLFITELQIGNDPIFPSDTSLLKTTISAAEKIHLPYNKNDFSLTYSLLDYDRPEKNEFAYKLSGFQEDWQYVGNKRSASYTNIPPGNYQFLVKATNNDGIWNEVPQKLAIHINAPWYWSWWSKTLYVFLIGGLLYTFYRFQLRRRLAEAETAKLLELDQVKTRLYTNITHEFRTPLSVIQGLSEQIPNYSVKETIQRNSISLLNLINQMLDLSKLEAGSLPVTMQQGDVIGYLKYLLESFHSFADSKKIRLHFLPEVANYNMDFDPDKLMKIVANLLSNALKFTEEGGDVYLQTKTVSTPLISSQKALQLIVKDTGMGISQEELPHIFDRFYQVNDSSTREGEGTGIGLAFTSELVKLLNGKMEVDSEVGKGSIFTVWLPITQAASLAQDIVAPSKMDNYLLPVIPQEETVDAPTTSSTKPLTLIIEDNQDVRSYLRQCLANDYQLIFAVNGQKGIDKAIEHTPDLILSDVMMPQKDGYEVCDTLKGDIRTSHIPIILLTAKADIDSRITGIRTGADAYIAKPFNRAELVVQLEQLLTSRELLKAYYTQSIFQEPIPAIDNHNLENEFLQQIVQLIEADYQAEWDVDKLCKALAMSRSQVYRKIKALTGYSTTIFIRRIRLDKAYQLLISTEKNISEIGYMVGFDNSSFFTKSFTQVYGQSPSEIRKKDSRKS